MDLIVNQVMELEVVHDTNSNRVIKGFTCTAIIENGLTVNDEELVFCSESFDEFFSVGCIVFDLFVCYCSILMSYLLEEVLTIDVFEGENLSLEACHAETLCNVFFLSTVEYGSHDLPAKLLSCDTEVNLKYLTDVHSRRYAQRVEYDIQRSTVCKEGHIFGRKNSGNDTLVTVTTRHLVTYGDLTLLSDVNSDNVVNSGGELVAIVLGEYLNVDNDTGFTVGNSEGCVTNFAALFAEDRTEKSFFCCKLCFTLRCNLTYENVA